MGLVKFQMDDNPELMRWGVGQHKPLLTGGGMLAFLIYILDHLPTI